ncbi:DEAD/DEAH box helicase [Pelagicoccus sp. SDUM812003]|uniref:DEAD/DEAH box helicase n=1 Tax=Pelagicoccus sp. SDUM812003 TaxID=3041267 RepID=UPI0028108BBA|nr:DEAD/DEAH box helicase [Pelagicoccus sp. SDUM812003]MDQ8201918.1 DEAD/DEAH box helicase [Pelagicoccus sp. SDUM812003]
MKTFQQLGVSPALIKGITEKGILEPTEIQERAIPFLIKVGHDFVGQAQTGTGKTAAYGLPLLQRIDPADKRIQGLVLAPTRELAKQIAKQLFHYTKYTEKIFTEAVAGGEKMEQQIAALSRPTHIVVATPGRLIELLKRQALDLEALQYLILDEADEMLNIGFKEDIDTILEYTQGSRRTWLFSATMPKGVRRIIANYMSPNAESVQIDGKNPVNRNIEHKYAICRIEEKPEEIATFIHAQNGRSGVVFCRSRAGTENLARELAERGIEVTTLQGELSQKERDKVMRAFKKKRVQVLVSTDVSARGIDVEDLAFVVHHQLPDQIEYYTHRSGRTARAGRSGLSIAFITSSDLKRLKEFEAELHIRFQRVG